jgi:CheY-like chemotaxis protein
LRLLLVDDEPDIRAIATLALERIGGWTVVAAASAQEAVRAVEAEVPEVVVLDVMMPDVDGPATLARLRPLLGQDVPVVFLTAKTQAADVEALLALGAAGVIAKPFDPLALSAELAAIIGR